MGRICGSDLASCYFSSARAIQNNWSDFVFIPKKLALISTIRKSINDAQESVLIITSMKRHPRAIYVYNRAIKMALSRGVRFRVIAGEVEEAPPKNAKKLIEHPLVSVKYISSPPTAVIVLVDNSWGLIMTSPTSRLGESPALQIGNQSLIKLLHEYFEYVWV